MRTHSSATTRFAKAITRIWHDLVAGQEALLARPWETEGDLRWVRGPGGPRLLGGDMPAPRSSRPRAAREIAVQSARQNENEAALRRAQ